MYILDKSHVSFQVHYIDIVTKVDCILVNVFKWKNKSQERTLRCHQQENKNFDRSIVKCDEINQISR